MREMAHLSTVCATLFASYKSSDVLSTETLGSTHRQTYERTHSCSRQAGKQGMHASDQAGRRLPELFIACVAASAEVASLVPGDGVASVGTLSSLPFIALPANSNTRVEACPFEKNLCDEVCGCRSHGLRHDQVHQNHN